MMHSVKRRAFVGLAAAAIPVARTAHGQAGPSTQPDVPVRKPKAVAKLFKSPEGHPNGLENTREGLWIAEEVSERAYLVDWTGKVLHKVDTESHNTSGIAVGGGFLWMSANGRGVGRDPRPTDRPGGEILQCDLKTGKTIRRFVPPWPGGLHGATWNDTTQTLWLVAVGINALVEVDPKDNFRIQHILSARSTRPHGLDFEGDAIWCLFADTLQIHKLEKATGKSLEIIQLAKEDPDPHGLCMHEGKIYYSDAGIIPPGKLSNSPTSGYICRIDL
jgi:hypothetical protein